MVFLRRAAQAKTRVLSARWLSTTARHAHEPFRLAVIGSGPAGFYTAYRIMNKIPNATVDMYESLPVPFGLVRHGVAPDHPEVKNCQEKFEEVASSPNFRFLGNVSVGHRDGDASSQQCHVQLQSLLQNYDSVLMSYGASEDKKLGISGESKLSGIYSAREFVGWYNGLPECAGLEPDLSGEDAVVIGQGNVAMDVARMLLEDVDVLRKTDIAEHALQHLAQSRVKRVRVVARRGPMQAAFTIKEVRELMKLSNVAFHPVDRSLIPDDLKALPRASKRLMEVLLKGTTNLPTAAARSWSLDSCLSPTGFLAQASNTNRVGSTECDVTQLESPFDPKSRVSATGESVALPSDVVFRSVGYRSIALEGFSDAGIQFDNAKGTVSNDGLGRVTSLVSTNGGDGVNQVPGLYCSGWLKNGPTGVIASTMSDAFTTGDVIIHDWLAGKPFLRSDQTSPAKAWEGVSSESSTSDPSHALSWDDWRKIDSTERAAGKLKGKEREKFTSVSDMLAVVR